MILVVQVARRLEAGANPRWVVEGEGAAAGPDGTWPFAFAMHPAPALRCRAVPAWLEEG
ncbi:hypothetical protein [Falsiroseomonas sp.]|uniref:hypothetical protein n=1 Tax=Falsiroseomonas sp. TaxID=2870721 RepID=UPI0034A33611